MCVLAMAWMMSPRWRLIVAGNRDEAHERPTAPLAIWSDGTGIIAGRDLRSGGTWMGLGRDQTFAVVTNLAGFGPAIQDGPSRGQLLGDFLTGTGLYRDPSTSDTAAMSPFSLITVSGDRATFTSNRPSPSSRVLPPSLYGLSNGELDAPWGKTLQLKAAVGQWLKTGSQDPRMLFEPLRAETPLSPPRGPDRSPADTPVFIRDPVYGTRCSTVVAMDHAGEGVIMERRFDADGRQTGQTTLRLPVDAPR